VSRLVLVACWAQLLAVSVRTRRRRERLADVEHELRGAAAAMALAVERLGPREHGPLLRLQLARITAALADLARVRGVRRPGPRGGELDAGRLAQVFANVIANAAEHGVGEVEVRRGNGWRAVRLEIRNRNRPPGLTRAPRPRRDGRGRGIAIAARAAREVGGRLRVESAEGETVATVELPVERLRRAA
jgi:signal transduction histidine kinase